MIRWAPRPRRGRRAGTGRPGVQVWGIVAEAVASLRGRTVRAWLTAAGIAMGIAATVATVGLSSTAQAAVSDKFDAVKATQVTASLSDEVVASGLFPTTEDSARVRGLNGVVAAGLVCESSQERRVSRTDSDGFFRSAPVSAVEGHALEAIGIEVVNGRAYDSGHGARGDSVVMIDTVLAKDLGITDVSGSPVLFIDGDRYLLIGIYQAPRSETGFTRAAIVPVEFCLTEGSTGFGGPQARIRTELGAAEQVGGESSVALWPRDPALVQVAVPPDLSDFRQGVEGDIQALLLGLAAVSLVIGAVSVSNTALVSVMERRSEIGLRRAVGASRRAIAGQFVCESTIIGVVGGAIGTVIGVNVTAVVSLARDWQVAFDPLLLAAGPVVGALVGVVAGVYPAWRASRVAPAVTLRS
ncbi:putative ABC transport system permease protein [Stackebrandtia albiflava]|uniref:Putative ABC transport system permease protein n=1 Tax=Stackebrandtia albiflava TaxID=406432 RepID=A0A562V0Z6_9ACTN|nr:ABC transporter permease [Stackebrandtia albiflava]TWJ11569.1 putative ABC transport system permease protein [Stackebrandtia albiflava]